MRVCCAVSPLASSISSNSQSQYPCRKSTQAPRLTIVAQYGCNGVHNQRVNLPLVFKFSGDASAKLYGIGITGGPLGGVVVDLQVY